jgi:hypothetical protein
LRTIKARNVNEALPIACMLLKKEGKPVAPRGMATIEYPEPLATTYTSPAEMILFDADRDANCFFHFFEALWILHGRSDVGFLAYFLPRMADFSDDGTVFHAPYGYRMRYGFNKLDQIELAIEKLRRDPDSRQAVLSIWDPARDWLKSKDVPCNSMVMFKVREGKLRMTVSNRSNDMLLGAYGANVVQFSTLLKYMAGRIGVGVGSYTQVSDSFHVYVDNPYWQQASGRAGMWLTTTPYSDEAVAVSVARSVHGWADRYTSGECDYMAPSELASGQFDEDLRTFFGRWDAGGADDSALRNERNYLTGSFADTVLPMLNVLIQYRTGNKPLALECAKQIKALDWRAAAQQWVQRRIDKDKAPPPALSAYVRSGSLGLHNGMI